MIAPPRRYCVIAVVVLIFVFTFLYSAQPYNKPLSHKKHPKVPQHAKVPHRSSKPTLRRTIRSLFRSIRLSPTQPEYHDEKGNIFPGAPFDKATWKKPFGKRLLIVDIDTRVPTGDNQILNPDKKINWDDLQMDGAGYVSNAISNHYLYAMIHGYDYKYYQALSMPDHYATWIRPHIFKELLPDYDFVVAMDADAVVSHLEVPLEWLFNRWNITENTSMALPHDTQQYRDGKSMSTDSYGVPVLNGGFVISHNNNLTFDMLSAWGNCTTETRYPGCGQWKDKWSHEQRAFSEYIRWDPEFNKTEGFVTAIPCDDAMGWPGFKELAEERGEHGITDCKGNFVRHYTIGKEFVKPGGSQIVMQALTEVMQKNLVSHQDTLIDKELQFHWYSGILHWPGKKTEKIDPALAEDEDWEEEEDDEAEEVEEPETKEAKTKDERR
ncbi:uncharacterized protein K460DRAFT_407596 [Cucurbitaria berberidis CBS 394.84]|uniref:Nucleotide-diphospho-sugar transferase domain-containing protein n=1 Tax=Cucurbitaria berberidis CBS 394.84 TaxID=1168544 RepID=A0A9P4L6M8_9PLEO|nr:uncharacterized protein K460DRAFT_407596 [Cucurbitaria berberidis CBS 394.84]KAF1843233.1 hypothetical protein K460DRAFT_407596 [Cucurbitaria berberidis CBS 394.84]